MELRGATLDQWEQYLGHLWGRRVEAHNPSEPQWERPAVPHVTPWQPGPPWKLLEGSVCVLGDLPLPSEASDQ